MNTETLNDELRCVKDYVSKGQLAEAVLLFKSLMNEHNAVSLAECWKDIQSILPSLPSNLKQEYHIMLDTIKNEADKLHEIQIQANKQYNEIRQSEILKQVQQMSRRPDKTGDAFDLLMFFIADTEISDLLQRRESIQELIQCFLPKKRKKLQEFLEICLMNIEQYYIDEQDLIDETSADDEADICIDGLLKEITELLQKGESSTEAYWLFCDTINAIDSEAMRSVGSTVNTMLKMFPGKQQRSLNQLLTGKLGGNWQKELLGIGADKTYPECKTDESINQTGAVQVEDQIMTVNQDRLSEGLPDIVLDVICGMKMTRHAIERVHKRGITKEDIEKAISFGRNVFAQGAEFFLVGKKEIKDNPEKAKSLRSVEGLHVVCSQGWIITAYKNRNADRLKR